MKELFPLSRVFGTGLSIDFEKIARIETDSRIALDGALFVAIKGERFDGHDFVTQSFQKGALAALVQRNWVNPIPENEKKLIRVDDPIESLRELAKHYRSQLKTTVIAVGGSNGKTTTKEWIAHFLAELHGQTEVFKTKGSENSILGVALSLLRIRNEKFSVLEIGIDEPGWMQKHLELVQPDSGVITSIAEEHLERLKNIETVAKEELRLLDYIEEKRASFALNLDCSWIQKRSTTTDHLSYSLTKSQRADIEGIYLSPNRLSAFGEIFESPLPGQHNAQNILAALTCVCLSHPEMSRQEIKKLAASCSRFEGAKHRSQILRKEPDLLIFNDCYNANPNSMAKALETFFEIAKKYEKILVLGDMRELGEQSETAHRRLLNEALVSEARVIYLTGASMKKSLSQLSTSDQKRFLHFDSLEDLKKSLKSEIKSNQAFLVKASRGIGLESVLEIFDRLA